MKCEKVEQLLMDSLMGSLSPQDRESLDEHLVGCRRCQEEASRLEGLWEDLGGLDQAEVPSQRMQRRFREALVDYQADLDRQGRPGFAKWWSGLWTARPAWQAAFSAAVLLLGILMGTSFTSRGASSAEIADLRSELVSMSRVVTLSLLQHQSASERLRAVSWSRMAEPDDTVFGALLEAARMDPNVNVRLAAVDALAGYTDQAPVRSGLMNTIEGQESPLVQLAVLEALFGEDGAQDGELDRLRQAGALNETVLQYLDSVQPQSL